MTISCEKVINESRNDIVSIFERIETLDFALQSQRVISDEIRKEIFLLSSNIKIIEDRQLKYQKDFDSLIEKINEQNEKLGSLKIIIEHNGKIIEGMMISEKEVGIKLKIFEKYEKLYWLLFSFIFTCIGAAFAFLVKHFNINIFT